MNPVGDYKPGSASEQAANCEVYVQWWDNTAKDKIAALNRANLSTTSLHAQLITEFAVEWGVYAAGAVAGTDD